MWRPAAPGRSPSRPASAIVTGRRKCTPATKGRWRLPVAPSCGSASKAQSSPSPRVMLATLRTGREACADHQLHPLRNKRRLALVFLHFWLHAASFVEHAVDELAVVGPRTLRQLDAFVDHDAQSRHVNALEQLPGRQAITQCAQPGRALDLSVRASPGCVDLGQVGVHAVQDVVEVAHLRRVKSLSDAKPPCPIAQRSARQTLV